MLHLIVFSLYCMITTQFVAYYLSPLLNLTELANSSLKALVKQRLTEPTIQERIGNREEAENLGITLQQMHLNVLSGIVEECLEEEDITF